MDNQLNESIEELIIRKRLRERRLSLNLTYQDLSDKTNISKSSLQRYETGDIKNLPISKVFTLAKALNINPAYFIDTSSTYIEIPSLDDQMRLVEETKIFEKKAFSIANQLVSQNYDIFPQKEGFISNLIAKQKNEIWHFDFRFNNILLNLLSDENKLINHMIFLYGRLAIYDKPITKFSFIVESVEIANKLSKHLPQNLNFTVSIALLHENGFEESNYNNVQVNVLDG